VAAPGSRPAGEAQGSPALVRPSCRISSGLKAQAGGRSRAKCWRAFAPGARGLPGLRLKKGLVPYQRQARPDPRVNRHEDDPFTGATGQRASWTPRPAAEAATTSTPIATRTLPPTIPASTSSATSWASTGRRKPTSNQHAPLMIASTAPETAAHLDRDPAHGRARQETTPGRHLVPGQNEAGDGQKIRCHIALGSSQRDASRPSSTADSAPYTSQEHDQGPHRHLLPVYPHPDRLRPTQKRSPSAPGSSANTATPGQQWRRPERVLEALPSVPQPARAVSSGNGATTAWPRSCPAARAISGPTGGDFEPAGLFTDGNFCMDGLVTRPVCPIPALSS